MKRYNAFTIQVNSWNSEFWEWLSNITNEYAYLCPQLGGDIFWFTIPPDSELFRFKGEFEWLSGTAALWVDGVLVTKDNYTQLDWEEMTDAPFVIDFEDI